MYARQRPVDKSKCIICQSDAEEPLTPLTDKGLRSVMNSCVARKIELNVTAGSVDSIPTGSRLWFEVSSEAVISIRFQCIVR